MRLEPAATFVGMPSAPTGRYLTIGSGDSRYRAFVPDVLPHSFELEAADYDLMERANRALGRLDGSTSLSPDRDLFLYLYIRKEAVLSSQIEGTQSSLSELLAYESTGGRRVPDPEDVQEVSRYVTALNHGLNRLRQEAFPLSLRLLREIHAVLMAAGRGSQLTPGEFRRTQNWLGGSSLSRAVFVPPPVPEMLSALDDLEKFLYMPQVPVLIKAAVAHVQFETIHPFLDGNGRVGRLLITFLLCAEDVLQEPWLYLSLYFKENRSEYYERLNRVRTHGEWRAWILFFLEGVRSVSTQAVQTAQAILKQFQSDRETIRNQSSRRSGTLLQVHEVLQRRPIVAVRDVQAISPLTNPTVRKALEELVELGIVERLSDTRVGTYSYTAYLELLERGVGAGSAGGA